MSRTFIFIDHTAINDTQTIKETFTKIFNLVENTCRDIQTGDVLVDLVQVSVQCEGSFLSLELLVNFFICLIAFEREQRQIYGACPSLERRQSVHQGFQGNGECLE